VLYRLPFAGRIPALVRRREPEGHQLVRVAQHRDGGLALVRSGDRGGLIQFEMMFVS
jgi:hypothetical protein